MVGIVSTAAGRQPRDIIEALPDIATIGLAGRIFLDFRKRR